MGPIVSNSSSLRSPKSPIYLRTFRIDLNPSRMSLTRCATAATMRPSALSRCGGDFVKDRSKGKDGKKHRKKKGKEKVTPDLRLQAGNQGLGM